MTTRRVTALEEQILALAIEWAEKDLAYKAKVMLPSDALSVSARIWAMNRDDARDSVLRLAKRLRKQREKK